MGGAVVLMAAFLIWQKSDSGSSGMEQEIAALNARIDALGADLAEIGTDVAGLAEAGAQQAQGLAEVAALGSRLAETVQGLGGVVLEGAAAAGAASGPADAADAADAVAEAPAPVGPGETASFGDGSVRVFVSRVDADAGSARIAVNGTAMATLSTGEAVSLDETGCSVSLVAIEDGRASFGYACGS
ncbi:ABC transporter C-terminal domain-containing protein [Rhodovulum strictum]|uniref:Uncharacterized protein n=1 Tax=Rhodovulum strictum TaxID=58314 RepID=A0A844BMR7_9RHOB|nr:ABC transporter C-terminal domain-containing protein [Rhodovulum strictum]MRH21267.1 hypothetical protein [Rhodovulum strictum]